MVFGHHHLKKKANGKPQNKKKLVHRKQILLRESLQIIVYKFLKIETMINHGWLKKKKKKKQQHFLNTTIQMGKDQTQI